MADEYYEALWDDAFKEIQDQYKIDKKFLGSTVIPDRVRAHTTLENSYIRYIAIINKLVECCSNIIQPQEIKMIKAMLENCIGRYLEIKHELVELHNTDFIYLDNLLVLGKKPIDEVNINVPAYYRLNRVKRLAKIDSIISTIMEEKARQEELKRLAENPEEVVEVKQEPVEVEERQEDEEKNDDDDDDEEGKKDKRPSALRPKFVAVELTEEEKAFRAAVLLLQRHERARVARLIVQLAKERIRLMDDIAWLRHKPIPDDVKLQVATVIGRYWKRYKERRHQTYLSTSRNIVLGFLKPNWSPGKEIKMTLEEIHEKRRRDQEEALKALEDAVVVARIRMEKNSDSICESIADELRYFIYTWYKATEAAGFPRLPVFPDPRPILPGPFVYGIPSDAPEGLAEKFIQSIENRFAGRVLKPIGGSALITAGHLVPVDVYTFLLEVIDKNKNLPKQPKKTMSKRELQALQQKQKEQEEKLLASLRKEGYVPAPSRFNDFIGTCIKDFLIHWKSRDITRKLNQEMVDSDVAMNLHLRLRKEVDEDMKHELFRLQNAINALNNRPLMEPKPPPKMRRRKSPKVRSEEEWVVELAQNGFVSTYNRHFIDDIPGVQSIAHYEKRNILFEDPAPQWGDFKQVIKEYCILPLGSSYIHWRSPIIRSVLVSGPQSLISKYLDSICTESGAMLFLLDPMAQPTTVCNKKVFDNIFSKVIKMFKPVVLHIPTVEKVFYKSVPKEEKQFNPKALAKLLPKIIKAISPGDQILVIGTSSQPWIANADPMMKIFDKFICFPEIDYHTLHKFWSDRLMKYPGVNRYINIAVLTNMTRGFEFDEMDVEIEKAMTAERIMNMKNNPLKEYEVCTGLRIIDKTSPTLNAWDWSQNNVEMYLQRQKILTAEAKKRAKENQQNAGNQDRKKKKKPKKIENKEKLNISNSLLSRDISRPAIGCAPYAPEKQIYAVRDYYNLQIDQPPAKMDLHRNEKSLETFPISKPRI